MNLPNFLRKTVFLDRDGTLIVDKVYLNDPEAIEYLPGVFSALRDLRDGGFTFAIATNQSGVARGIVPIDRLFEIHRRIRGEFARNGIDFLGFYYAPYMTLSGHFMRKPNPGMLLEAAREHKVDLRKSWMVGDRMIDVEAGHRAGTRSILLGQGENPDQFPSFRPPETIADNLIEASRFILKHH